MAIISCPTCQKNISDTAIQCVHCGHVRVGRTRQPISCPECSVAQDSNSVSCRNCGYIFISTVSASTKNRLIPVIASVGFIVLCMLLVAVVTIRYPNIADTFNLSLLMNKSTNDEITVVKQEMLQIVMEINADMPLITTHAQNIKQIWTDALFKYTNGQTYKYTMNYSQFRDPQDAINLYLSEDNVKTDIITLNAHMNEIDTKIKNLQIPDSLADEYTQLVALYTSYAYSIRMLNGSITVFDTYLYGINSVQNKMDFEIYQFMETLK